MDQKGRKGGRELFPGGKEKDGKLGEQREASALSEEHDHRRLIWGKEGPILFLTKKGGKGEKQNSLI